MKKILILSLLILCNAFLFGQNVVPRSNSSLTVQDSRFQAQYNLFMPRYQDTTAANVQKGIDSCGAIIYTRDYNEFWMRACSPKRWVNIGKINSFTFNTDSSVVICYSNGVCDTLTIGNSFLSQFFFDSTCMCWRIDSTKISIDIDNFTFDNDSTLIVCFANGACDTLQMNNFYDVVTNIIQNFNDSSVYNLNDSTLIICHGVGVDRVCDTINLGNSNTYYITITGDTLITCDTIQIICDEPGACYEQQLCDTILLSPGIPITQYQNGLRKFGNIVEWGSEFEGDNSSALIHDTYINTGYAFLKFRSNTAQAEGVRFQKWQALQNSSSITSYSHYGSVFLAAPNEVKLYSNYIAPMFQTFPPGGDSTGFMEDRAGYAWMVNSQGGSYRYYVNDYASKQSGILFHTVDTSNIDGVTIFAQQYPSAYDLYNYVDSNLLSKRVAVFKTNQDVQFPNYPDTRNDGAATNALFTDADGNVKLGLVTASTSIVNIISDTSIEVCNINGCDTLIVDISNPSVINIYNDTTIIICNEAGSCDTLTINNYTNIVNGLIVNIANTVFVAKSGNDGTGVRQRLDLPFLTIQAALAAAFTGDVIVVYPGTYEEALPINLAKSVNYHFIGKGELRLSTSVASGALFTDSATVSYSKIWGEHWTFNARSSQRVLNQTAASTVVFVADSIVSDQGRTINTSASARTTITANYMYTNGTLGGALWIAGGYFYGDIGVIQVNAFGTAVWLSNVPSFTLHSKRIFSINAAHAEYMVEISDCNPTDSVYIVADEIISQLEWATWVNGESPNVYISAKRISSNSDCTVTSTLINGGLLTVEATVIETVTAGTIDGIIHSEGGNLRVIDATIKRPAGNATGADVKTREFGGNQGTMQLIAVTYDTTKVTETDAQGTITRTDRDFYSGISGKFTQVTDAPYVMVYGQTGRELEILPLDSLSTTITADNATSISGTNNVQLGSSISGDANSPLLHNTFINTTASYYLEVNGSVPFATKQGTFRVVSTAASSANDASIYAEMTSGTGAGVVSVSTNGTGVRGTGALIGVHGLTSGAFGQSALRGQSLSTAYGVYASSLGGEAALLQSTNATTNSVLGAVQIQGISTGGAAAAGFGAMQYVTLETATEGNTDTSTVFTSKWVDPTLASSVSQLDIMATNVANNSTIMSVYGGGVVGIGISSVYTATRLNVVDNTIATTTPAVVFSSSAGASVANQRVAFISATGANSVGNLTSYALEVENIQTGSNPVNVGIRGISTTTFAGAGVQGTSDNGYGVQGVSIANHGVVGSSTSANGGDFTSSSLAGMISRSTTGIGAEIQVNPSSTNSVVTVAKIRRLSSGTAAAGLGGSLVWEGEVSNGTVGNMGSIQYAYTAATASAETSTLTLKNYLAGSAVDALVLAGDGSVKLRPITAAAASAITPTEGMLLIVSDTDGTFTSTGFWGYSGGAWGKLTN